MHHEQDTDKMGGLASRIPQTHWTFGVGVLAIAGFPLLSGFFSKEEVLLSAFVAEGIPGHQALYAIGLGTAVLTAFYMVRLHARVFFGECRAGFSVRTKIREPGRTILAPLWVLAFLAVVAGMLSPPQLWGDLLGIADSNSLHHFLAPALAHGPAHDVSHATGWLLVALATAAFALGSGLAWSLYVTSPARPARIRRRLAGLHRVVRDKFYVDELYDAALVRPLVAVSDRVLHKVIDVRGIDGAVNGGAALVRGLAAHGLKYAQTGLAQSYVFGMIVGVLVILGWLVA